MSLQYVVNRLRHLTNSSRWIITFVFMVIMSAVMIDHAVDAPATAAAPGCQVPKDSVAWVTNGNGSWHDKKNWSTNAVPGSASDVVIACPSTVTVTFSKGNTTIRSIATENTLKITGGALTVTSTPKTNDPNRIAVLDVSNGRVASNAPLNTTSLTLSNGTIAGTADLTIAGTKKVPGIFNWSGGVLGGSGQVIADTGVNTTIGGGLTKTLGGSRTFVNKGTATWQGAGYLALNTGTRIENQASFTINTNADHQFIFWTANTGTAPVFDNLSTGTVTKIGNFFTIFAPPSDPDLPDNVSTVGFNNNGQMIVQDGGIALRFGTSGGRFTIRSEAALDFAGNHTLSANSVIQGDAANGTGVVRFGQAGGAGGTVNVNGTYNLSGGGTRVLGGLVTFPASMSALASFGNDLVVNGGTARFDKAFPTAPLAVIINGGVATINTSVTLAPVADPAKSLTITGGTLNGTGTITVAHSPAVQGTFTWTGGGIGGSGQLIAESGTVTTIGGGALKSMGGRTFINRGTATWQGGGDILLGNAANIENFGTFIFNINVDEQYLYWNGAGTAPIVYNRPGGTLIKRGNRPSDDFVVFSPPPDAADGSSVVGLHNEAAAGDDPAGKVIVEHGHLGLRFGTSGGEFVVWEDGGLLFMGSHTLTASSNIHGDSTQGTGEVHFGHWATGTGGTVTVNGTYDLSGGVTGVFGGSVTFLNTMADLKNLGDRLGVNGGTAIFNTLLPADPLAVTINGGVATFNTDVTLAPVVAPARSLTLTGGVLNGSGTITVASTPTASGSFNWTGGILGGVGGLIAESGTVTTIGGGGSKTLGGSRYFENKGTATWQGGGDLILGTGTSIVNRGTFTFNINVDEQYIYWNNNTGLAPAFYNSSGGTLIKMGNRPSDDFVAFWPSPDASDGSGSVEFYNLGEGAVVTPDGAQVIADSNAETVPPSTVIVQRGHLLVRRGVSGGEFIVWDDAALIFAGTHDLSADSRIRGDATQGTGAVHFGHWATGIGGTVTVDGTYDLSGGGATGIFGGSVTFLNTMRDLVSLGDRLGIDGGTATFDTAATVPELNLIGGILAGTADITATTSFDWTVGSMTGTGHTITQGTTTISGAADKSIGGGRTLANEGHLVWRGAGNLILGAGIVIENRTDASFNIENSQSISWNNNGSAPLFRNFGTLAKVVGSGTTTLDSAIVFTNEGMWSTVEIESGTVRMGTLTSEGIVFPGLSPGSLTVTGDYIQTASGRLIIDVGGVTCDAFRRLNISGTAMLAGTLTGVLFEGCAPSAGQSFIVMTFASHEGDFTTVNLPAELTRTLNATNMILSTAAPPADPLVVTNANDSGPGSFRAAIAYANSHTNPDDGVDEITFNIPGNGPHTISPLSPLPTVTEPAVIAGWTQPNDDGGSETEENGPVAGSGIVLNGANAGPDAHGLSISAGETDVVGFVINNFSGAGIYISGAGGNNINDNYIGTDVFGTISQGNGHGIWIDNSGNNFINEQNVISGNGSSGISITGNSTGNVIAGNIIGLDASGTQAIGNGVGIDIHSSGNIIGGTQVDARNIISGNGGFGIRLNDSSANGNVIQGNYIGTDISGTVAFPNQMGISSDAPNNTIGGVTRGAGNLISGNRRHGIELAGGSSIGNVVQGNSIGTDYTGTQPLGNGDGIGIDYQDNTIGGTVAGSGNIIAFNVTEGVRILGGASGNSVQGNSIFSNGTLGIDLAGDGVTLNDPGDTDGAPNGLQNYPVLTSATSANGSITIAGTLDSTANATFRLEFFANTSADLSGYGEGEQFLGATNVTTDGNGHADFNVTFQAAVPLGQAISATATDAANNTSEFAQSRTVTTPTLPVDPLVVTNTNDSGPGSLRAAIEYANSHANPSGGIDTIRFDIPSNGPHTINPTSALPAITDSVVIDGTTQPGFAGSPIIELRGSSAGASTFALDITAGGSTVRGLVINRFSRYAVSLTSKGGNVVEGNFIGVDVAGTTAVGNQGGIYIEGTSNNRIGGTAPGSRNVISGTASPIAIAGDQGLLASNNLVQGNYIGTDATGMSRLGAGKIVIDFGFNNLIGGSTAAARNIIVNGVEIHRAGGGNKIQGNFIGTDVTGTIALSTGAVGVAIVHSNGNTIGGTEPGMGNVISGFGRNNENGFYGIQIVLHSSTSPVAGTGGNIIQGNYIGTDASGTAPLGNAVGISIQSSLNNQIGGTVSGAGNVIAFNLSGGIRVHSESLIATGNLIRGNTIHDNGLLGIDLVPAIGIGVTLNDPGDVDEGSNDLQNFPIITSATSANGSITISGTLNSTASTIFHLEFFANTSSDPSGYGEGERFLGARTVVTDSSGNAGFSVTFDVAVLPGQVVTATATDAQNNTSEFSQSVVVTS